ncbi:MAG: serine/threonine protein phosphatase [Caulobacterales bacterium]|nr:serine/threonine protein phosphatase [Caulobacterales bacterium]
MGLENIIHSLDNNSKQTLVIGDVHGRYDLLKQGFDLINILSEGVNTNIVLLGDYIDRGENSKLVIEKLRREFGVPLGKNHAALMGNHEQMCLYAHDFGFFNEWVNSGGDATLNSYNSDKMPDGDIEFIRQMPIIAEDRNGYYVHAGINSDYPINSHRQYPTCLWLRHEFFKNVEFMELHKPIIYGHTPREKPMIHRDRFGIVVAIGIDTGAEFSDNLTLLQITEDEEKTHYTTWSIGKNHATPTSLFW